MKKLYELVLGALFELLINTVFILIIEKSKIPSFLKTVLKPQC